MKAQDLILDRTITPAQNFCQLNGRSSVGTERRFPGQHVHHRKSGIKERRQNIAVFAWGRSKSAQTSKTVPVTQNKPSGSGGLPFALKIGAAIILAAAVLKLVSKLRGRGSMGDLESRGFVAEGGQTTSRKDPFYKNMMKNYNTVQYQELSTDQIEAARQRRSQDRRNDTKVDLTKISLPANHPFAVSKQISDEQEKLELARLNVRRGMPLKDAKEADVRQGVAPSGNGQDRQRRQLPAEVERRGAALQRRPRSAN